MGEKDLTVRNDKKVDIKMSEHPQDRPDELSNTKAAWYSPNDAARIHRRYPAKLFSLRQR